MAAVHQQHPHPVAAAAETLATPPVHRGDAPDDGRPRHHPLDRAARLPLYPSNHATISAGMAHVLAHRFPAHRRRLAALAEEAALSRVFGDIHYRFDGEAGLMLGREIAAWAIAHDVRGNDPYPLDLD